MEKDTKWEAFFAKNHRYADIINGLGCNGEQIIQADDLQEADNKSGKRSRDALRKAALGMNFIIVGIENQDNVDYRMPFRNMAYDVSIYEKQLAEIHQKVRKHPKGISSGEYLYGFRKDSKLHPVITFVLYSGKDPWDGAQSLHELLDFTDVPKSLQKLTPDYKINVIEIRKFDHSEIFKTDVRQVFDFIRLSEDKEALLKLVEDDGYYKNMDTDAFNVIAAYTNSGELLHIMNQDKNKKGAKIDMCGAIKEMIEDGRADGRIEERSKIILRFLSNGGTEAEAIKMLSVTKEDIETAKGRA